MTPTEFRNASRRAADPPQSSPDHEVTVRLSKVPLAGKVREIPLGIAQIAQLLDVKPGTVERWRQRGIFPTVELTVGGSPAWWTDTILEWATTTGRTTK